jgi:pimeloyl-ACP methyl ester carboxylesterase
MAGRRNALRRVRTGRPRGRVAQGLGLIAGIAAMAAGGIAIGVELEQRIVNTRIARQPRDDREGFFELRSDGPLITTPDGVVLYTEIDEPAWGHPPPKGFAPTEPAAELGGPTLVFVHGYALNLDCWHFQRKHFRGRLRQVFYDQRSHGRSGRSAPELCRIPQLAEDLGQILDEVAGPGPLILVGHSMGGMAIMRLAQSQPERFGDQIRGVALFMTAAGDLADYSPIRGLPGRAFSRIAEPLMATLNRVPELVAEGRRAGSDLSYVVTKRMSFGSDVPANYVEFVTEMIAKMPLEVIADYYPAFADLNEYEALGALSKLPVAIVGGTEDMVTTIEHTERIVELLPDAEATLLQGCGHLGMIEHHEACNTVLDRLIERAR